MYGDHHLQQWVDFQKYVFLEPFAPPPAFLSESLSKQALRKVWGAGVSFT